MLQPKKETETPPTPEVTPEPETPTPEIEEPTGETKETPEPKKDETPTDTAPKKEKKVSPWRIIDDYKKTTSELKAKLETYEKELGALKSGKPTAEVPKEIQDRLTAAEKRVQEYEDELRFTNYQKHPEFVEKYQKPYDAAWARAVSELSEVSVTDPATGTARPAQASDMLTLLNLPLGKARELANQVFGELADDAMAHRKEIKSLFDAQQAALAEAKTKGVERQKQLQAQQETERAEMGKFINDTWSAANREATTDAKYGKYFLPVEGDQEGNATLAKGFDLVDKAFKEDPREPGISQEERAARIRRHVAMRNRAAAFGRLRRWVEQRDAKIAELQDALDEYAKSEPGQAGGTSKTPQTPSVPANPFARFEERLQKRAR